MLSLLAVNISEGRLEEGTCNYAWDDLVLTWSKVLCNELKYIISPT